MHTLQDALVCLYASAYSPDHLLLYSTAESELQVNTDLTSNVGSGVRISYGRDRVPYMQVDHILELLAGLKDHAQLCLDVLELAEQVKNSAKALIFPSTPGALQKPLSLLLLCSPTNLVLLLDNNGNIDMDVDLRSYKKHSVITSIFSDKARLFGLVNLKRHYEQILEKLDLQSKKQQ